MKRHLAVALLLPACAVVMGAGCVRQNDYDVLQQRVQMQDQQLRQIQPAQADVWAQVQAMRQELNAFKGQMDDLQSAGGARALVDRVNRHDAALRQVESSLALNLNLDAPLSPPVAGGGYPVPFGAEGEGTPSLSPEEAQAAMGAVTPAPPLSGNMVIAPQQHAPTPPPPSKKDMATALFDAGMAAFNARRYQEAERSFSDFAKTYPNDKQIASAWYYIGECHFQGNNFADAALAYDTVITKYPTSSRAPGAYLKQGIAFSKLKQSAAAKARMQELIKKFPHSAEAARAKNFLQTNK